MPAVEMQVKQVSLDPVLGAPVVILEEKGGGRSVPIWVGQTEVAAIVSELRKVPLARPSSHDLMNEIIFRMRGRVARVAVTDHQHGTFFAEIVVETAEGEVTVDARASDAIALALRAQAPIFVEHTVVERTWGLTPCRRNADCWGDRSSGVFLDASQPLSPDILDALNDEDFGKWKM